MFPRRAMASICAGNDFYIFGGMGVLRNDIYNDLWILDIKNTRWFKPHWVWKRPAPRYCGLLKSYGEGRLLLFGGKRWNSKTYKDTWIYDIENNLWKEIEAGGPSYIAKMGSGSTKDKIYLFGGQNEINKCLNDLWIFDVNQLSWAKPNKASQK